MIAAAWKRSGRFDSSGSNQRGRGDNLGVPLGMTALRGAARHLREPVHAVADCRSIGVEAVSADRAVLAQRAARREQSNRSSPTLRSHEPGRQAANAQLSTAGIDYSLLASPVQLSKSALSRPSLRRGKAAALARAF
jgi:hypothetical protein